MDSIIVVPGPTMSPAAQIRLAPGQTLRFGRDDLPGAPDARSSGGGGPHAHAMNAPRAMNAPHTLHVPHILHVPHAGVSRSAGRSPPPARTGR